MPGLSAGPLAPAMLIVSPDLCATRRSLMLLANHHPGSYSTDTLAVPARTKSSFFATLCDTSISRPVFNAGP